MTNKKIVIEVGSHKGLDTERFVNDDTILYCFEPNHELYVALYGKYKYNDNVFIFPFAVDIQSGFRKFNIQTVADKGCSSLNVYNKNINTLWKDRTDFTFGDAYTVPTISLKDFINIYKLNKIDYLWIDAQGSDYQILQGLGNKIDIVQNGRCEAALNVSLYETEENNYSDIIKYLSSMGFLCEMMPDESGIEAECNIQFTRKLQTK